MSIEFKLSKNEEQIMRTLWKENRGLTRSEVIDLTENKTWKESSIHILLNQLLDKGAIKVEGTILKGINTARLYVPTVNEDEYEIMQLKNSLKDIKPKKSSIKNILSAFIDSEEVDNETILELEKMLQDKKEK